MSPSRLRIFLAALLAGCALAATAAPRAPLVTMLDGEATLLRDGTRYALAEGVRLQAGDLLATGPNTRLLRIEGLNMAKVKRFPYEAVTSSQAAAE